MEEQSEMATDRRKTGGRSGMHRNIPLPPRLYAIRDTGTVCDTTARPEAAAKATGVWIDARHREVAETDMINGVEHAGRGES